MTLAELKTQLETTGIPVAYNVFKAPQAPPYICYIVTSSDNTLADGHVYNRSDNVQIELYTRFKDSAVENKVEGVLLEFSWEKDETPLEDEDVYLVAYQIQI